ncbi:MAG: carboxypeptidase M32 [Alphaproteobacteria bacterium]|nr:carboxypeptidase M32 [Alphaproteobacteria bacterium]
MSAYRELERRFARIAKLRDAAGVLHWDQSVMMPLGGVAARAEQLATLQGIIHELLTAADMPALLADAAAPELDDWQAANLALMRRAHGHAAAVPGDLVEAFSRAVTGCEAVWRTARQNADFAMLLPSFAEVLRLVREIAAAKGAALGLTPYDALLDQHDPGRRSEEVDRLFATLEAFLPDLLQRVMERQRRRPPPLGLTGRFGEAAQRTLGEQLMRALGFDFHHGRLDSSQHPFTGGVPEDVRITTRYAEDDFTTGLMAVLHETGHALYERGLPAAWRYQPVGNHAGMTAHESQSLIVEMQACRGRAFVDFLAPLAQRTFGGEGPAWRAENLYRLYTKVEPGYIRVDADEVTYPAHVILRYQLEKAMIFGDLQAPDLPGAWNEGMVRLLAIRPPNDREGCLQDIHWPDGGFGYFPTYTLGAMSAAQLFEAAERAAPELEGSIGRGDFGPLTGWLRANVHAQGARLDSRALIARATGRPLDPAVFRRHLERRYLAE